MIQVFENYPISSLNTFKDNYVTRYLIKSNNPVDIAHFIEKHSNLPYLIIGGGSNLLFTKNFEGILIIFNSYERQILLTNNDTVVLRVGASWDLDKIIEFAIDNNWGGLENLSLIPGTVGAMPVQNVGAYGVEAKDVILQVSAFDLKNKTERNFDKTSCRFTYRDSIFKHNYGRFLITAVTFRLSNNKHKFHVGYGELKKHLEKKRLSLKYIRQAIIDIRTNKLPNTNIYPNAGSFFKNPIVSKTAFLELQKMYPGIPFFKNNKEYKIPAAWLIEQCGFKDKTYTRVGVFHLQPLIVCKFAEDTTGQEVADFGKMIQDAVFKKFSIQLQSEVNIF